MSWKEKHQPFPFDENPFEGLFYLIGARIADVFGQEWARGQKLPLVSFPSGKNYEIWASSNLEKIGTMHIFGEMDLPLVSTRDEAFEVANDIAEACGYMVQKIGDDKLEAWGHDEQEHVIVVYDNNQPRIIDIQPINDKTVAPPPPLLTDEHREKLPPLYANEELGLMAVAIVKFFTPDANFTWYASEFDGEDTFFGLVCGLAIELGYFSLEELQTVRGRFGLPVERDKHFKPKTLKELKAIHERGEVG